MPASTRPLLARFTAYALATLLGALTWGSSAQAATMSKDLITFPGGDDSGWTVSWDDSLGVNLDFATDAVVGDTVLIQKFAIFTQPPGPGGIFPPIAVTFMKLRPSIVSIIAINDEIVTNQTGVDWTDFHFELLGDAEFDPALTDASAGGSGFSSTPFLNQMWGPVGCDTGPGACDAFWVDGFGLGPGGSNATVADGDAWFPGSGISDGELFIQSNSALGTTFAFKETPTVTPLPEPSLLSLLGVGIGMVLFRRRI